MPPLPPYRWKREQIRKMIEMVKERDCLWNVEHQHYHNQIKRRTSLVEIESVINIPVKEIKKKLHTLRAQYSKERSKMKMTKSGNSGREYITKWEFFDLMQFMFRHTQKKTAIDSTDSANKLLDNCDTEENLEKDSKNDTSAIEIIASEPISKKVATREPKIRTPKRKQFIFPQSPPQKKYIKDSTSSAFKCMKTLTETVSKRDEYCIYGEHIANKLKNCGRSKLEIAIAQNEIDNICFKLIMGGYCQESHSYSQDLP